MKPDDLLRERLLALAVPESDPVARARALDNAIAELRTSAPARPAQRLPGLSFPALPRRVTLAVAAAIMLLVVVGVMLTVHRPASEQPPALTAERALLSQMEGLFGSQLDAVIEAPGRAPDIRLAANPTDGVRPGFAQPVLILFRRIGGDTTRVFGYSGRTVCVTLDSRQVCFEPLVTGRGEVILSGPSFCWTPGQPDTGFRGYQVTARPMSHS